MEQTKNTKQKLSVYKIVSLCIGVFGIITAMVKLIYPDVNVLLLSMTIMMNGTLFPFFIGIPVIVLMQEELHFKPCPRIRKKE